MLYLCKVFILYSFLYLSIYFFNFSKRLSFFVSCLEMQDYMKVLLNICLHFFIWKLRIALPTL